jgi:hypothetical protein
LVTPDDVLRTARSSASMNQTWGPSGRFAANSLGSSVDVHHRGCSALECATKNFWLQRYGTATAAIFLVGLVCWAANRWIPHATVQISSAKPVDGLTIFAVFFVAALAIERLLEPLSNALLPRAPLAKEAHDALKQAGHKASEYLDRAAADTTSSTVSSPEVGSISAANTAIDDAASAVERLNVRQLQRATAFWVIATCLGILVAAAMNLYFMNTVGITAGQRWEEILATGLIIGAGTKPLHELVKLISSKSAAAGNDSG